MNLSALYFFRLQIKAIQKEKLLRSPKSILFNVI
jgi:hypothetical protein